MSWILHASYEELRLGLGCADVIQSSSSDNGEVKVSRLFALVRISRLSIWGCDEDTCLALLGAGGVSKAS